MPVYRIPKEHVFPPPYLADRSGVLGVGGDLHPDRVLLAYQNGIFPWYSEGEPLLWWSPDPRLILRPRPGLDGSPGLHVSKSLVKRIKSGRFEITLDRAFSDVLAGCAEIERPGQGGTWLTEDLQAAFRELHRRGITHSVEAWEGGELVGGLYGVAIGRVFCGESMFALRPDASKVAFVWLVRQLDAWGFPLVDCQVYTPHLARFGAYEVSRHAFLRELAHLRDLPGRPGRWTFDEGFHPLVSREQRDA